MKKLLLFGGAFNPPHKGHMKLLEKAIELIEPDLTVIIATSTSPHKQSGDISFYHRNRMSQVFKKLGNVKVSRIENKGRKKRNYTIQSIKWLEKRYKDYEIYLLIGSDMLISFTTWSRYRRILSKATLVVAAREEHEETLKKTVEELEREGARIKILLFEPIVISSSEIRNHIHEQKEVGEYLDEEVAEYIEKYGLYR